MLAVALGCFFRLRWYAYNASYWEDEAYLLFNVTAFDIPRLLGHPLDLVNTVFGFDRAPQAGPPLFLLALKAITQWSTSESATRALPLAASLAAVFLFADASRRLITASRCDGRPLSLEWVAVAVALFATSEPVIFQSATVKAYSTDVFASALLLWIASRITTPTTCALALCAAGSVLTWLSYTSVVPATALACLAAARVAAPLLRPFRLKPLLARLTPALAGIAVLWGCAAACYLYFAVPQKQAVTQTTWADQSHPQSLAPWHIASYVVSNTWEVFSYAHPFLAALAAFAFIALIAAVFARRAMPGDTPAADLPPALLQAAAPIAAALVLGIAGLLPFLGNRITIYLVPFTILTTVLLLATSHRLSAGLSSGETPPAPSRAAGLASGLRHLGPALAAIAVGWSVSREAFDAVVPDTNGGFRQAFEHAMILRTPDEWIVVPNIGDAVAARVYGFDRLDRVKLRRDADAIEDQPAVLVIGVATQQNPRHREAETYKTADVYLDTPVRIAQARDWELYRGTINRRRPATAPAEDAAR